MIVQERRYPKVFANPEPTAGAPPELTSALEHWLLATIRKTTQLANPTLHHLELRAKEVAQSIRGAKRVGVPEDDLGAYLGSLLYGHPDLPKAGIEAALAQDSGLVRAMLRELDK